jgi:hypothetical protein
MPVIINGQPEEVRGLESISYIEDPRLRLRQGEDMARRVEPLVRGIVLHTSKGIPGGGDQRPQVIRPGIGPSVDAGVRCSRFWSASRANAGAHLVVDFDGAVSCCADLLAEAAYHAGPVNQSTIGIEIYQGSDAELYEEQLDAVVLLVDWLTRRFGIQRQIPDRYRGTAIPRLSIAGAAGKDYFGIYGHRDVSTGRGAGDPGSAVFQKLFRAGYEDWNIGDYEDQAVWKGRQRAHGIAPDDGVPGPKTVAALAAAGFPHGLWTWRPGDDPRPRRLKSYA